MRTIVHLIDRLTDFCAVVAAAALVAAMLIVVWMVAYRATGHSTFWEIEAATYLIVATVLIGSPYCLRTHGHIGVDLVSQWLGTGARRRLGQILAVGGLLVCAYLAWQGLELTIEAFRKNEHSGSLWNPPRWPFFALMPVGLGLTALQYVAEMFRESGEPTAPVPASGQGA